MSHYQVSPAAVSRFIAARESHQPLEAQLTAAFVEEARQGFITLPHPDLLPPAEAAPEPEPELVEAEPVEAAPPVAWKEIPIPAQVWTGTTAVPPAELATGMMGAARVIWTPEVAMVGPEPTGPFMVVADMAHGDWTVVDSETGEVEYSSLNQRHVEAVCRALNRVNIA
jgi:hypothetical protein